MAAVVFAPWAPALAMPSLRVNSSASVKLSSQYSEFSGCQAGLHRFCKLPEIRLETQRNVLTVQNVIKRRKDPKLDSVIQRNKKFKMVLKIKEILCQQPNRAMSLKELGFYRKQIGIIGDRRLIVLLKRYPLVFEVFDEGSGRVWFRFTDLAEKQYLKERELKDLMEPVLVDKVRKLLMMSDTKTLTVEQISHIRRDIGLPEDFKFTILRNYPQYFSVKRSENVEILELTSWDPQLAISKMEHDLAKEAIQLRTEQDLVKKYSHDWQSTEDLDPEEKAMAAIARGKSLVDAGAFGPPTNPERVQMAKRNSFKLAPGFKLGRRDLKNLQVFMDLPFVSPYADPSQLDQNSLLAEKRNVAVIHELLSLTVEKRLLCDHFTHFRKPFKLTQRLRGLIIRHPEYFYVSEKGLRDSVFLREAYEENRLIAKDPLSEVNQGLRRLVWIGNRAQDLVPDILESDDDVDESDSGSLDEVPDLDEDFELYDDAYGSRSDDVVRTEPSFRFADGASEESFVENYSTDGDTGNGPLFTANDPNEGVEPAIGSSKFVEASYSKQGGPPLFRSDRRPRGRGILPEFQEFQTEPIDADLPRERW